MSYIDILNTDYDDVSDLNFAIAQAAQAEGWTVKSVPAISDLFTFFSTWPIPFEPIEAFSISKTGGGSGEILTPPSTPPYTAPPGFSRTDMSSPVSALPYIAAFLSGSFGWSVDLGQVSPSGSTGYYLFWIPDSVTDPDSLWKVTRPSKAMFDALVAIGSSLGIQTSSVKFGGYILKSQPINGASLTVWLDNGEDISAVSPNTQVRFYVTASELMVVPHPRTDAGKPVDSSAIQSLLAANQAATVYLNSKNLWSMANEVKLGANPHWYAINIKPQPNASNAIILCGEQVPLGPRFFTSAPVWWLKFNDVVYIRPTNNMEMQLGRLHSYAGDFVPIKWNGDITECLESLAFIIDISHATYAILGLVEDVLVAHSSEATDHILSYDGVNFIKVSGTGGAAIMVRQ